MTRGKCLITESALHVKQDKLIHIKCYVVMLTTSKNITGLAESQLHSFSQ